MYTEAEALEATMEAARWIAMAAVKHVHAKCVAAGQTDAQAIEYATSEAGRAELTQFTRRLWEGYVQAREAALA